MIVSKVCSLPMRKKKKHPPKANQKTTRPVGASNEVALAVIKVATILAAVDGVYRAEEKAKLRAIAKQFQKLRGVNKILLDCDEKATKVAAMRKNRAKITDVFKKSKTSVDVAECIKVIAEDVAYAYPAILSWVSMCCCDSDYAQAEQKAVEILCAMLSKECDAKIPMSFVRKAEKHIKNIVLAQNLRNKVKDPFRKSNLSDVIAFEQDVLVRMAKGKEF